MCSEDFAVIDFRNFDDFRYLFRLHFGHFWESWETNLMICWCIGYSLKFQWISGSHQNHPKLREDARLRVNCLSRASSNRSISPACWPLDCQTPVCWPVDHQIVIADGMLEEYLKYDISMNERITLTSDLTPLSSQPGGPWQAGAGGYTSVNPCISMHRAKRSRVQWLRARCDRDQQFRMILNSRLE